MITGKSVKTIPEKTTYQYITGTEYLKERIMLKSDVYMNNPTHSNQAQKINHQAYNLGKHNLTDYGFMSKF